MNKIIYDKANFIINSYKELKLTDNDVILHFNKNVKNYNNLINRIYVSLNDSNISRTEIKKVVNDIFRDIIAKNNDTI